MSFIYVTGAPGVGKSTLQKELSLRGFEVYDIDDAKLGGAHNKASGERVVIPPAKDRKPEWYDEHEWRVDQAAVNALKEQAVDRTIFICGVAPDDEAILPLFDKIFYLKLDEHSLKQRIAARVDNDYGKNANELTQILERQKRLDARYIKSNAVVVDATLPPSEIVDLIVQFLADDLSSR